VNYNLLKPVMQLYYLLESLYWFSQRRSAMPHFRSAHPGGLWPT